ncbi:MAG: aspartyl-tRNA(Asn)/glutamyl-tRNA(Gln) amidotransferase subunit [Solirubrobacteraceae bacterium]|jgi:fatty acid amide hydrolase 2|nr:aspartyl-tRNA(Asn)/glutamyl-tRNA(Gln) amidotransferase subunit [Solirubrobacteraceae bacterium]
MAVLAPSQPLIERSATDLARAIRTRETSSRDVVEAHIERIEFMHERINAVVVDRFDAARAEADAADALVAATADPDELPPFHGVPCTIKESIAMAGMPNCAGLVSRNEYRSTENAPTVQRMIDAGAIVLGVTNTPELCLWIETENRQYGRTNNAYSVKRTAGGSSGGEGAVVGSGGSPLGLGADIGGSIRLPAFFNGVFGLKPSPGVVPSTGQFPTTHTEVAAQMLTIGPIVRRAEDLWPMLEVIAGRDGIDPYMRDVQLGDPADVSIEGMKILLSEGTSYINVSRELRAARMRAAEALEQAGAIVETTSLKSMKKALELYLAVLKLEAGVSVAELIVAEGSAAMNLRGGLRRKGPHTRALRLLLMSEWLTGKMPQGRMRKAAAAREAFAEEVAGTIGDGVLLHPTHPRVAPRHGQTVGKPWLLTTTAVFNLAGTPVAQIPLGLNKQGLPLGVQAAAGPDRDHLAVAVAIELERAFGGWVPPPDPS